MPLTANAIVTLSLQTVNAPGWVSQAQQMLNVILADLADTVDLDLCRGKFSFTMAIDNGSGNGSGPYNLPLDYKRAERDDVFYIYNGTPYVLISIDLAEYDMQVQQAGIATYPYFYATDTSGLGQIPQTPPVMYLWPPSSIAVPLYVRYRRLLPDITDFTQVPWFPNQEYLISKLNAVMAELTSDDRAETFRNDAARKLDTFMKLTNDDEGRAKHVSLDRRRFGQNYASLPNTKTIGF